MSQGPDDIPAVSFATLSKLWESAQPTVQQLRPYINKFAPVLRRVSVDTKDGFDKYIAPHWNDDATQIAWNLILIFFGGQFALTIMAVQSFNQTGGEIIRRSLLELKKSYIDGMKELHKDPVARDLLDSDGDGYVSFSEICRASYAAISDDSPHIRSQARQLVSICLRCVNPNRIMEAFIGLWTGLITVIACLRSKVAKCVSIGARIGQHISRLVRSRVEKRFYELYPDHRDWVDVGLKSGSAAVGIIISLVLMKVVNSVNSAVEGSQNLIKLILKKIKSNNPKFSKIAESDTPVQSAAMALVIAGVLFQLRNGFSCPWYLKLILAPAILSESILSVFSVV